MTIVILGAGPAGLFAAHAVSQFTEDYSIFAPYKKSVLQGAQYLHRHIPGLTNQVADRQVTYRMDGNGEDYSINVYGTVREDVSWNNYASGKHSAWDLRRAYDRAWDTHRHKIIPKEVSRDDIVALTNSYDLVINTVPLTVFATSGVGYQWQDVWIETLEDQRGDMAPIDGGDRIHYNGMVDRYEWYRYSYLFGWASWEYAKPPTRSMVPAVHVRKPLRYVGNPVPDTWLLVGRYGAWRKAALTHDAYYETVERMMDL
jgi:hypothetical protein